MVRRGGLEPRGRPGEVAGRRAAADVVRIVGGVEVLKGDELGEVDVLVGQRAVILGTSGEVVQQRRDVDAELGEGGQDLARPGPAAGAGRAPWPAPGPS